MSPLADLDMHDELAKPHANGTALLEKRTASISYFPIAHNSLCLCPPPPSLILHKLSLRNALGNIQTSQEHFTTMVSAKFWGQTKKTFAVFRKQAHFSLLQSGGNTVSKWRFSLTLPFLTFKVLLFISISPFPHPVSLPLLAGIQFSRDSIRAFNDRI